MLESLTKLIKDQFSDVVNKNADIATDKKGEVVETATTSMVDTLKNSFSLDNLSSLTNLFGGSGKASDTDLSSSIQNTVTSVLVDKLGLSKSVAGSLTSVAIPTILSSLQKKVNDPNESGFSIESIIKSFASDKSGGLLGTLGGLFGK